MSHLIPEGFAFATDAAPAHWIVERLKPWGKERVSLWSFMPDVFGAYARVFHPFFGSGMTRVRWSELAERRGIGLSPTTRFKDVTEGATGDAGWEHEPQEGTLDEASVHALRDVLAPFTETPQRCWLAVWMGWGSWRPGSRAVLVATNEPGRSTPQTGVAEPPSEAAVIRTQHREYYLLHSSLDLLPSFGILGWHQSPSIWWPEDKAWCVVTEVDGYSTYVGGTEPCVDAIVSSTRLDAVAVPADAPMDPGPY